MFEAELARQDQIRAARQEQAARTAQTSINTLLGVRDAQVGAARASASAFEEAYRVETDALRRTAEARTTIVRNTVSGWRDLGAAGAATLANIEAGRRLGSLGNVPEAANQNVARRLRSDEVTNLMYQGGDVAAQLGSGSPLSMIAMQQGPQIAQIFAGPGGASVKGAFAQAGEAVAGFVSRIGLVGGAIGGVTAAVVAGIAATVSYRSSQQETEKALAGVGRTSGVTLSQINDLADAQVRAGNFGRRGAREIATVYAGSGRVGPENSGPVSVTAGMVRYFTHGLLQTAASLVYVGAGRRGRFRNLRVVSPGVPGTDQSWKFTLQNLFTDTALTCTISGAGSNQAQDLVNSAIFAAADRWSIKVEASAGANPLTSILFSLDFEVLD